MNANHRELSHFKPVYFCVMIKQVEIPVTHRPGMERIFISGCMAELWLLTCLSGIMIILERIDITLLVVIISGPGLGIGKNAWETKAVKFFLTPISFLSDVPHCIDYPFIRTLYCYLSWRKVTFNFYPFPYNTCLIHSLNFIVYGPATPKGLSSFFQQKK